MELVIAEVQRGVDRLERLEVNVDLLLLPFLSNYRTAVNNLDIGVFRVEVSIYGQVRLYTQHSVSSTPAPASAPLHQLQQAPPGILCGSRSSGQNTALKKARS